MLVSAMNRAVHYCMCTHVAVGRPAEILDEKMIGDADLQVMSSDVNHQTWCEEACFEKDYLYGTASPRS